jgi:hypothetical protein
MLRSRLAVRPLSKIGVLKYDRKVDESYNQRSLYAVRAILNRQYGAAPPSPFAGHRTAAALEQRRLILDSVPEENIAEAVVRAKGLKK